jgi:hypothetical protein
MHARCVHPVCTRSSLPPQLKVASIAGLEDDECPEHADFILKNRAWAPRASGRPIALLPPLEADSLLHDFKFDAKKGTWAPWLDK